MSNTVNPSFFRRFRVILIWIGVFVVALLLDSAISHLGAPHYKFFKHHSKFAEESKELGEYWATICIALVLAALHARRFWASALLLVSGAIGGLFEVVFKWVAGRSRPVDGTSITIEPFSFLFFRGGIEGLVHQKNLCFPSGHTTLAFATATCLAFLCPKGRYLWFAAATLVGIERVAELAHYPSDVVAGAMFGTASFYIAKSIFDSFSPQQRPATIAMPTPATQQSN